MKKASYIAYLQSIDAPPTLYRLSVNGDCEVVPTTDGAQREVRLLLSARLLTLLQLTPPKNSQQYARQLLPHLVEPHIATPLESVVILSVDLGIRHKPLSVAVIDKVVWQYVTQCYEQFAWQWGELVIDALCLPIKDNKASLLSLSTAEVLWRAPDAQIFSGSQALLEHTAQDYPIEHLNEESTQSEALSMLFAWAVKTKHRVILDKVSQGGSKSTVITALLMLLALGLWTFNLYRNNQYQRALADAYYNESVTLFHKILPQYKRIPTRSYLTQQLSRVSEAQAKPVFWYDWLALISEACTPHEVEILSLTYKTKPTRLQIMLKAREQSSIEAIVTTLSESIKVSIIESDNQENTVISALEVTL